MTFDPTLAGDRQAIAPDSMKHHVVYLTTI